MPAPILTLNAAPASALEDAPIGVAVALSDSLAFAGVVEVTWELTTPPGSAAALAVASPIAAAPFTNSFVPDVPGNYRVRLITTDGVGATAEDTGVVRVLLPYELDAEPSLPAPLEALEEDASIGWADEVNRLLRRAHDRYRGADVVVFLNETGAPIAAGAVVQLGGLSRWPDRTGGGTGVPVVGAPLDYIAGPLIGAGALNMRNNLHLVLATTADNARGLALRRGIVPWDTAGAGWAALAWLYYDQNLLPLTTTAKGRAIARAIVSAAEDADPAGNLWFDPTNAEEMGDRSGTTTLADATAVAADVDAAELAWPTADTSGVAIRYRVKRGASPDVQLGRLYLAIRNAAVAECIVTDIAGDTTVNPGVVFSGAVAAGVATLQFTSTATGDNATFDWTIEEVYA